MKGKVSDPTSNIIPLTVTVHTSSLHTSSFVTLRDEKEVLVFTF